MATVRNNVLVLGLMVMDTNLFSQTVKFCAEANYKHTVLETSAVKLCDCRCGKQNMQVARTL